MILARNWPKNVQNNRDSASLTGGGGGGVNLNYRIVAKEGF